MRTRLTLSALLCLTACGGGDSSGPPVVLLPNAAPSFTSAATGSVVENSSIAYVATASDPDGNSLAYAIAGGADALRFSIASDGTVRFVAAPNFELPGDTDADNIYLVQLRVSDGSLATTLDVRITVTDSREGIRVRRVVAGLSQPLYVAPIPGSSSVLVAEKGGRLLRLNPATGATTLLRQIGSISTDGERGLLGLAASPTYQTDGQIYAYVTATNGDIQIRRYNSQGLTLPQEPAPLLSIPHRDFSNHNGGWLGFGADGLLYIATGDGGGAGDPQNNSQNTRSLLGKILRIGISSDPFAGSSPQFTFIPADNPFANGQNGAREILAYGFRNPFRASFYNGNNLLVGDVGQGAVEEIDLVRRNADAGANYGWRFKEGTRTFTGTTPAGLVDPVAEYFHGSGPREGRSITGGYVYRGPVPSLVDQYVFADFVSGNIWSVPASLLVQGQTLASSRFERRNVDFTPDFGSINQIASFGEDATGNLYIVDLDGEIFVVERE